jgi:hypothetical protein
MNPVRRQDRSKSRSLRAVAAFAGGASLAALWAGGCGIDNAIVGGVCALGYSPCGDTCCLGEPEGGLLDGSSDGPTDVSRDIRGEHETDGTNDRETKDSRAKDGRTEDAPANDTSEDTCVPPYDSVEHCGACDHACISTDVCSPVDGGGFQCVPLCSPPLTDCGGTCVDESNDPDNCGTCGKICASGFCVAGLCQGTTPGDIVVIGYDYRVSQPTVAEATILSNAAFIPSSSPLRILSFEHYADATAVSNVKAILNAEAVALGRMPNKYTVSTTDADIPAKLNIRSYDELIVYDQKTASATVLGALGSSWQTTLSTFTAAGGVVISLDGAEGMGAMPTFNTSAGLLAISDHTVIPNRTPLEVIAPGDVVARVVVTPFASELDSVYFTTSVAKGGNVAYVVVDPMDGGQAPVVVHVDVP